MAKKKDDKETKPKTGLAAMKELAESEVESTEVEETEDIDSGSSDENSELLERLKKMEDLITNLSVTNKQIIAENAELKTKMTQTVKIAKKVESKWGVSEEFNPDEEVYVCNHSGFVLGNKTFEAGEIIDNFTERDDYKPLEAELKKLVNDIPLQKSRFKGRVMVVRMKRGDLELKKQQY